MQSNAAFESSGDLVGVLDLSVRAITAAAGSQRFNDICSPISTRCSVGESSDRRRQSTTAQPARHVRDRTRIPQKLQMDWKKRQVCCHEHRIDGKNYRWVVIGHPRTAELFDATHLGTTSRRKSAGHPIS